MSPGQDDRVALVTGGSRGIGASTVDLLIRDGARVVLTYVQDEQRALKLVAEFGADRVVPVQGDVASPDDADRILAMVEERLGRLDLLVNNAGVIDRTSHWEAGPAVWDRTFAVNVLGPWWMIRRASGLLAASRGSIVNVSSTYGVVGSPAALAYSASKAALQAMTEALAVELAPAIRVNAVAPGNTLTDLTSTAEAGTTSGFDRVTPLGRSAWPREIAEAIVFLGSPAASFVTGQVLVADGGYGIRTGA